MAVSWDYYFQFYTNQIFGRFFYVQPLEILVIIFAFIGLLFLIGIMRALYRNYKKSNAIETLLFLISMIAFLVGGVLGGIERFCYSTWGLPQLGDLIRITVIFPVYFSFISVNIFALKTTFPEKFKIILPFLLILTIVSAGTVIWAELQGPPYARIINFAVAYSLEINLIRLITLSPLAVIPTTLFFYYAIKNRIEDKPKSNLSFWLGMGFLFFTVGSALTSAGTEFFGLLFILSAAIFYVCFKMPGWFKKCIGWPE